jgi:hypothetical protein
LRGGGVSAQRQLRIELQQPAQLERIGDRQCQLALPAGASGAAGCGWRVKVDVVIIRALF